jgi:hypothetical protein
MHPEIVRDEPGTCPICGMALEPMTVSLEDLPDLRHGLGAHDGLAGGGV